MNTPLRVLIVEDSENDAMLVVDELRFGGYDVEFERVETRGQMQDALNRQKWDVIICDYRLPDFDGMEALELSQPWRDTCPFIIVSGQIGEDVAVNAVKAGANDYILKDNLARLLPAVQRELREAEVRRQSKEAQEALQAERERSHDILESISDGFYALDKDWRFTYVNGAAEQIIGQDWRSLKGKSIWEVFPYAATLPVYEELYRAMAERVPVTIERFYDRLQVWYTIRAYPYADGLAVYLRDITAQKRADEEIRKREELLQTIQNSFSAQIAVLDHTGTIIAVNESWVEAARADGDPDLVHTGVGVNYLDICRRALAGGDEGAGQALSGIESVISRQTDRFEMEYPFTCKTGPRWFHMRVTPLRSKGGGAVVVHLDVTQRVLAEQRLRESEERLRKAMSAETIGVLFFNLNGHIHEANATFERWSSYSSEELRSMTHWEKLTAHDFLETTADTAHELATTGKAAPYEKQMIRKDGSAWWGLFAPTRLSGSGRDSECVEFVIDITERKLAEEAMGTARRRAEALEGIAEAGIATTDLKELLDILVVRMSEVLGSHSCSIWMLDEETNEFVAKSACGVPEIVGSRLRIDEGVAGPVYRERKPVCVADAELDALVTEPVLKIHKVRTLISVPLISRDKVVGMARVGEDRHRFFSDDEVGLIEAMAARAAQAIDNIKLYDALTRSRGEVEDALERERHFSLLLQRALLPEEPSIDHGYSVAVQYLPYYMSREIGGDFYDIFEAGDNRAGIVIGDVSGKGLESASLAANTRSTIHALVHETDSSGEALARANSILCRRQSSSFEANFVTVFLVIIDLGSGNVCYASAGHPPAAIYKSNGEVHYLKPDFQPPICLIPGTQYPEACDTLMPGESLVLFTDGVAEARRDTEMFDLEGIERTLVAIGHLPAQEIASELITAANRWAEGHLSDDAAVVVVKREA